jgi:DeoR family transcriptional regulator, fructose operon transcriptional repressor
VAEHRIPAERQQRIHRLAEERGIIGVAELSALLEVSEITIRRDLDVMERRGVLERARGGAICTHRKRVETLFAEKGLESRTEKEAIGRAAADLIEDGDTVLINGGSTTLEVIRRLGSKKIQLITNNVAAALEGQTLGVELILLGGEYRGQSNSVVGGFATAMLRQVYGSKTVIGIDGVSVASGLTNSVADEAEVTRHMVERTRGQVIVVADHRKLAAVSNFVVSPIDAVDILVTDQGSQQEYRRELEEAGVRILIAPSGVLNGGRPSSR